MRIVICFITSLLFTVKQIAAQEFVKDSLIFNDDFNKARTDHWIIEKTDSAQEKAIIENGKLLFDTYGGVTAWYKQELSGNYYIRFKRTIIMKGGKNDRVSDCNLFWMATDPLHNKLFQRKGAFNEYDSLSMYYVGMGGNYNSTTRFRKYDGKGDKKILGEFTDSPHLLQANKEYLFEIIVKNGTTQFKVDGQVYFSFTDPQLLTHGWFAFRSTRSRQEIDDLEIWRIH